MDKTLVSKTGVRGSSPLGHVMRILIFLFLILFISSCQQEIYSKKEEEKIKKTNEALMNMPAEAGVEGIRNVYKKYE